ncbi:hypothetical protein [Dyadobacter aurulentus]|uniref:hypothetical protein n=1 Tax=Dyadobacter sp. UC 10 TaxID=2605428 RepID=UPI0011F2D066|nr:hypothetical protein [Dyadobacter sp. UC 10]KAA0992421.1 hypothetical protein FXO21_20670 [Dyadobacter sp. UC 10]
MKKSIMIVAAALFFAITVSYSQSTSTSTSGSGSNGQSDKQVQESSTDGQNKQGNTPQTGNAGQVDTRSKQAQKSTAGDGSTRPGGRSHENANDVGRYSEEENEKSMTHSKKALAARRKNLTEADTTVKKGSGSAPKNSKNLTGKTGNYQNQEIKHNQKTQSRP